jgi:hypothetical protein
MCPSGANVQPDTINLEHPLPLQHTGAHNATLASALHTVALLTR